MHWTSLISKKNTPWIWLTNQSSCRVFLRQNLEQIVKTVNCPVRLQPFFFFKTIHSKNNVIGKMKLLALTASVPAFLSSCAGAPSPSNANANVGESQLLQRAQSENTLQHVRRDFCLRPGKCSWWNSGTCEKHCGGTGLQQFGHMEGCGWGRKKCCCTEFYGWPLGNKIDYSWKM